MIAALSYLCLFISLPPDTLKVYALKEVVSTLKVYKKTLMQLMLITKELSKAARGLAGMSAAGLSDAAKVPIDTIKSFESGRTRNLSAENQDKVQKALEAAGVQFLDTGDEADGPGVALKY